MVESEGSTTSLDTPGTPSRRRPRVVVVGAGFAGLAATKQLAGRSWTQAKVQVTVIDRVNHHANSGLFPQVVAGRLRPSGTARPVRSLIRELPDVEFRLATVTGINVTRHQVDTDHGSVPYDYLVLAAGAVNDYAGENGVAPDCMGLTTLAEALALRDHALSCVEAAVWAEGVERSRLLTFAVVGGGPTGVEAAAALAELVDHAVGHSFPPLDTTRGRVTLVEAGQTLLGAFAPGTQAAAVRVLRAQGVEVMVGRRATALEDHRLSFDDGRCIEAATVVWAAGVRANPLAETLPATGCDARVLVDPTLQVERHPDIFVVGDMAEIQGSSGAVPMRAPVAIQSGRRAARSILALCAGRRPKPFHYRDLEAMVSVGRHDAVGRIGPLELAGLRGRLAWLVLHIVRTPSLSAKATALFDLLPGRLSSPGAGGVIAGPTGHEHRGTTLGPQAATGQTSMRRAKVDLPSVNVSNANRWGRVAALAWWSQAYPGLEPPADPPTGYKAFRRRVTRVRHEVLGDKSQTAVDRRG